jgi:hypothetical protein
VPRRRSSSALDDGAVFGAFRVSFLEGGPRLANVAFMINARTRITQKPWGDQAQFARRETLLRYGRLSGASRSWKTTSSREG